MKFPSIVAFNIYLNLLRLNDIIACNLTKHLPNTFSNISKSSEKRNLTKYLNMPFIPPHFPAFQPRLIMNVMASPGCQLGTSVIN